MPPLMSFLHRFVPDTARMEAFGVICTQIGVCCVASFPSDPSDAWAHCHPRLIWPVSFDDVARHSTFNILNVTTLFDEHKAISQCILSQFVLNWLLISVPLKFWCTKPSHRAANIKDNWVIL